MEFKLQAGLVYKLDKTVRKEDTAIQYNSGLVEVFATPAMIAMMEQTALLCVQEYLPENFGTVGFEVSIKHIRPTPVGGKVSCEARLTEVDGRKLVFELQAGDEGGEIGRGTHTRYIIDQEKFMKKLHG